MKRRDFFRTAFIAAAHAVMVPSALETLLQPANAGQSLLGLGAATPSTTVGTSLSHVFSAISCEEIALHLTLPSEPEA